MGLRLTIGIWLLMCLALSFWRSVLSKAYTVRAEVVAHPTLRPAAHTRGSGRLFDWQTFGSATVSEKLR